MRLSRLTAIIFAAFFTALVAGLAGEGVAQGIPSRRAMVQIQPGLWVDQAATGADQQAIGRRIAAAAAQVRKRLGTVAAVEWWICTTRACDQRNAMAARGMTWGASVITLNAAGARDGGAYTHELSHATLHAALPMGGLFSKALPLWFDEGVAVLVSGEPARAADRAACRKPPNVRLPQTARDFAAHVGSDAKKALPVYTASACAVRDWMRQGNRLHDIVPSLRAGRRLPG